MTKNDSDVHRDPQVVADQLTSRARQHFIRVSKNATDAKIPRPQQYKKQNFGGETNI